MKVYKAIRPVRSQRWAWHQSWQRSGALVRSDLRLYEPREKFKVTSMMAASEGPTLASGQFSAPSIKRHCYQVFSCSSNARQAQILEDRSDRCPPMQQSHGRGLIRGTWRKRYNSQGAGVWRPKSSPWTALGWTWWSVYLNMEIRNNMGAKESSNGPWLCSMTDNSLSNRKNPLMSLAE